MKHNFPYNWHERLVVLWSEDECLTRDPSAEHITDAVVRICGNMYHCADYFAEPCAATGVRRVPGNWIQKILGDPLETHDGGDVIFTLFRRGWVIISSYDGESLAKVAVR